MGDVGARLSKFSNRYTFYNIYPIELKLDMIILVIDLHNRYEQDIYIQERGPEFQFFLRTSLVHVPLSRHRRNLSPRSET